MALSFDLLRPDDLVVLTIELVNFRLDKTDPKNPLLKIDKAADPAYLIAHFPPQSIAERTFFETSPIPPPPYNVPPPPATAPPADPGTSDTLLPPGQVPARMSGPSRLVFRAPSNAKPIPFTVEALLDWSGFTLAVTPVAAAASNAKPSPGLAIAAPKPMETALEIPYRLILSPNSDVGWLHATIPVTHAGRTELWHTRMARMVTQGKTKVPVDPTALNTIPLRAIWTPDFVGLAPLPDFFSNNPPGYLTPMTPRDRNEIVILTSGFDGYFAVKLNPQTGATERIPYVPQPVQASRVFLTALGGWLSSRGHWDPVANYEYTPLIHVAKKSAETTGAPAKTGTAQVTASTAAAAAATNPAQLQPQIHIPVQSLELSEWDHIATMGRDHYVKIVYEGFLYPFGHRASLVKVSDRKFIGGDAGVIGDPVAYLTQRMYIVVRETDKTYVQSPYAYKGYENPFRSQITMKTIVTPEIDQPAMSAVSGASDSFWVQVNAQDLPWHISAVDLAGSQVDFHGAMIFVPLSESNLGAVQTEYVNQQSGLRRAFQLLAKDVAYADPAAGDTALKTKALYFDTQGITQASPPYAQSPFIPKLDANRAADVTMPALEALTGGSPDVQIHLYQQYLSQGLDGNAGVFAEVNVPPAVGFSANKSGGFARPNLTVSAVTARKGLTGGKSADAAKGLIDPAAFFGDVDAKLFGTVPLKDLIPIDPNTLRALAKTNAPEIRTHSAPNARNPQTITTKVSWAPELVPGWPPNSGSSPLQVQFNTDGNKSSLALHATFVRYFNGTAPTSQVHGALSNFLITLFDVVGVKINSITFDSTNGSKTMVAAHLPNKSPIQFLGALAFVQKLADVLPPGIFGGSGPTITMAPSYLKVSFTIGLPPISVGVLSIENIAITTGLDLPYLDGKPEFEFAFASRSNPFLITVECLGGGGFVHLVISADGVQMVEGALEFGGEFSIDLGVASGSVHIMAGIYFQLTNTSTTLTGFVDIGGEVSVLGIISISIDLNLSLSFVHNQYGNKVQGRATLTISVHVLFFGISVSVSVERSFGDHGGDPRMKQLIGPTEWAAYADAIA
jgi:hypothetical protein